MRIAIRVRPGSARPGAGGEHAGALVVRVSARAVDGKATEAALATVADAFGVRRSAVRLVSGAASRTKIVDIDAGDPQVLAALLAAPAGRLADPGGGMLAGQTGRVLPAPTKRRIRKGPATSGKAKRMDSKVRGEAHEYAHGQERPLGPFLVRLRES